MAEIAHNPVTYVKKDRHGTIECYYTNNKTYFGILYKEVDGYYTFWAKDHPDFAADAWLLRLLADKIDELNKPWDDELNAYFEAEKAKENNA